ncbi:glycosyltransferase [Corynebacterium sp. p3-SID1194]|uniref:glycosyltransferase n=1 Tax=Corynebacterium sp. p3-SID1194 TaxID=2916105 RepID=UPI002882E146|nr:galactosyltransferase-related protein [Corynebacterium sp. p3-SID1194]
MSTARKIVGIYAHHHGSGHIRRCRRIQRELAELGWDAVILSTAPDADIVLADDAGHGHTGRAMTAGGTLHYAPYGNRGLRERYAAIASWVDENDPAAFYVDVSAEVCMFLRLMGVPVVTLAMPGLRDDAPHQLAYRQSDAIIAAWPSWVPVPDHLRTHSDRLHPVGGITLLDRPDAARGVDRDPQHVVVMAGRGGSTWEPGDWDAVEAACPGYRFTFLTGENRVDDPTELIASAGVVVAAGGQNSIADIAHQGAPAVILPQPRPFIEQKASATLLAREGLAVVPEHFPAPEEWPDVLAAARELNADWSRWETAGSARRAAEVIARIADDPTDSTAAIVTLANAGRASHLTHQVNLAPEGTDHITVALADHALLEKAVPKSHVVDVDKHSGAKGGHPNLARARNRGAAEAIARGNDVIVFLDADCVAGGDLVPLYMKALAEHPDPVVAGPVTYMKEGELRTVRPDPHPARPNPPAGEVQRAEDYNLFWSLSFACTAQTWERIVESFGGFDEAYSGYGGEDTDFAWNLREHGIDLLWVGGAHAFHQWHPVSSPPWEHLDDILRNAAVFHSKWGTWPMEGWLRAFEEAGAIALIDGSWQRTP